ncbi:MAG: hypothetical protein GX455_12555 [Phycisphaerae bacterium]|nr:hypothetical protein [Phycisphaerae bacterium]
MSERMKFSGTFVLFLMFGHYSFAVAAAEWGNQQISSGVMVSPWELAVDGDQVAFVDGGQVMLWVVGQTPRRISGGQNSCRGTQVSGGIVGWMEQIGGKYQAMLWDGQGVRQLSDGRHDGYGDMLISDGKAAWQEPVGGARQIFYWDGQARTQITANMKSREVVRLNGNLLVWNEFGTYAVPRSHIYCYQDQQLTYLARVETSNLGNLWASRSLVVWIGPDSMDDAQVFVAMKGLAPATKRPDGDVNGDLKIDLQDFMIVSSNWLVDCAETPENAACQPE